MKNILLFTLFTVFASGWIDSCDPPHSELPCETALWTHTYGAMKRFANPPQRMFLHHQCVTVKGRVESISPEADGDLKIKLSLAKENFKPYGGPFDNKNDILYNNAGDLLVVEVVCVFPDNIIKARDKEPDPVKKTYYKEMIDACAGYKNHVTVPKLHDQIAVTGELLTDTGPSSKKAVDHGWGEIHPVTGIKVLTDLKR
jgi:hypothetical protein